jgi:uncharacterized protein (DUF1800 family)
MRLRRTRHEHIDDLRIYFSSYGAINGLRSSTGGQLDRLRDGVNECGGSCSPEDKMLALIEPDGYMAQVRAVYRHCAPVIDHTGDVNVARLDLALATYPDPAWAKFPASFLATTPTAHAEFTRTADLWRKKAAHSKAGERMSWTAAEFAQWMLFRSKQRDGKPHRILVAKMLREASDMFETALSSYELAYSKVYNGLGTE